MSRRWFIHVTKSNKKFYVKTCFHHCGKTASCLLQHFLIGRPLYGRVCDHINGDPRDNRRDNLRVVTKSENCRNRALNCNNRLGVQGVARHASKFRARIRVHGRLMSLGSFTTIEQASAARLAAEAQYFGAFAPSVCRKETA